MSTMAHVNRRAAARPIGVLTDTEKKMIEMGGFIGEMVIKDRYPDLPKRIIDMVSDTLGPDENLFQKICELSRISIRARTLYRRNLDYVRRKYADMSDRSARQLEERFFEWYLEQAVRFRFGAGKDKYAECRKYIDMDGNLKAETRRKILRLEPVEYMVFAAGNGISVCCSRGFMTEATEYFNAEPVFIEIMQDFLVDNVDHYMTQEEFNSIAESGICSEFPVR